MFPFMHPEIINNVFQIMNGRQSSSYPVQFDHNLAITGMIPSTAKIAITTITVIISITAAAITSATNTRTVSAQLPQKRPTGAGNYFIDTMGTGMGRFMQPCAYSLPCNHILLCDGTGQRQGWVSLYSLAHPMHISHSAENAAML
jgi:hypothetical protein